MLAAKPMTAAAEKRLTRVGIGPQCEHGHRKSAEDEQLGRHCDGDHFQYFDDRSRSQAPGRETRLESGSPKPQTEGEAASGRKHDFDQGNPVDEVGYGGPAEQEDRAGQASSPANDRQDCAFVAREARDHGRGHAESLQNHLPSQTWPKRDMTNRAPA